MATLEVMTDSPPEAGESQQPRVVVEVTTEGPPGPQGEPGLPGADAPQGEPATAFLVSHYAAHDNNARPLTWVNDGPNGHSLLAVRSGVYLLTCGGQLVVPTNHTTELTVYATVNDDADPYAYYNYARNFYRGVDLGGDARLYAQAVFPQPLVEGDKLDFFVNSSLPNASAQARVDVTLTRLSPFAL
jgi:hypothetical protein